MRIVIVLKHKDHVKVFNSERAFFTFCRLHHILVKADGTAEWNGKIYKIKYTPAITEQDAFCMTEEQHDT